MADADTLVVVASHLRPEEAGMLRGLLESAGLVVVVRDEMLSSVNPFLQPIIGGAKVAVRKADEARARDIIRSAGVVPGLGPDEPVDIPEEEWRRPADEPKVTRIPTKARRYRSGPVALAVAGALILAYLRCAGARG